MNKPILILLIAILLISTSLGIETTEEPPLNVSHRGYIVELKDKPIVEKKLELEKQIKDINQIKNELRDQELRIESTHSNFKNKALKKLNKKAIVQVTGNTVYSPDNLVVLGEYTKSFNGIALDITEAEANKLKEMEDVEAVYPNYEVKALLMDSVPLIEADDVWQLDANLSNCGTSGQNCLTGSGVNIAIIDTGVDYTHPDLGGQGLQERYFEKINGEQLSLWWFGRYSMPNSEEIDQQISLDNNRLAYYSRDKFYIYDFNTNSTQIIDIFSRDNFKPWIVRLVLRDNFLAFFTENSTGVFNLNLYDLSNGDYKVIGGPFYGIYSVAISNNKVIYGKSNFFPNMSFNMSFQENILVYDILTGQTISIAEETFNDWPNLIVTDPVVSNDLVAYLKSVVFLCYTELRLYNIINGEERVIYPPEIGPVLDFEGNKILYSACNATNFTPQWKKYYLYNIDTSEYIVLGEGSIGGVAATEFVASWIQKGSIGENIIFFSKDITADRILAYDLNLNRQVQINLVKSSGYIDAEGKKVCFLANDLNVYCHDYDSSFDYPLPDYSFNEKVVGGYDFVNNDNVPIDDNGHGTHVAATAAGNGSLKGVAPSAKIYAYKVLNGYGSGSYSNVIRAIEAAIDPNGDGDFSDRVDIISMSLGVRCWEYSLELLLRTYPEYCGPNDPLSQASNNAVAAGTVVVVAAGNDGNTPGTTIGCPGCAKDVITVGATYKKNYMGQYWGNIDPKIDQVTSFSSRGPIDSSDGLILKPDIVAPGAIICAARYDSVFPFGVSSRYYPCLDEEHVQIAGTSMATPIVAGAAALLKQKNPSWTPLEIKAVLKNTAIDSSIYSGISSSMNTQGYGRLDILSAIISPRQSISISRIENIDKVQLNAAYLTLKIQKKFNENWTDYKIIIDKGYISLPAIRSLDISNLWNFKQIRLEEGEYLAIVQLTDASGNLLVTNPSGYSYHPLQSFDGPASDQYQFTVRRLTGPTGSQHKR